METAKEALERLRSEKMSGGQTETAVDALNRLRAEKGYDSIRSMRFNPSPQPLETLPTNQQHESDFYESQRKSGAISEMGEREFSIPETIGRTAQGIGGGLVSGILPSGIEADQFGSVIQRMKYGAQGKPGYDVAEFVGEALPYAAGYGVAGGAVSAAKAAGKAIPMLARTPIAGGLIGGGVNLYNQAGDIGTENFDASDLLFESALGAGGDALIRGVGQAGKKIFPKILKQAGNLVESKAGKEITKKITLADEKHHRMSGEAMEGLSDTSLKKKIFKKNATGEELADRIEAGQEPGIKKVMDSIHKKATSLGIKMGYRGGKDQAPKAVSQPTAKDITNMRLTEVLYNIENLNKGKSKGLPFKPGSDLEVVSDIIRIVRKNSHSKGIRELERLTKKYKGKQSLDIIKDAKSSLLRISRRSLPQTQKQRSTSTKGYFPRLIKREIAEKISDDLIPLVKELEKNGSVIDEAMAKSISKLSKQTKNVLERMVGEGKSKSYANAIRELENRASGQIFGTPGFTKKRTFTLPSSIYERDARKVIPQYVNSMTKYMAQVETFGKDLKKSDPLFRKLAPEESGTVMKIIDTWTGELERQKGYKGKAKKFVDGAVNFEFATKIGLGTATIPNVTQSFISTIAEQGLFPTLKGGANLLTKSGRKMVRRSGALNQSMLNAVTGYKPEGLMGKVAEKLGTYFGFTGINKFNMSIAASTIEGQLKKWNKQALRKGKIGDYARKRLGDFNLTPRQGGLKEDDVLEKMYRFATDSQLQKNILKDPLMFNDPKWRPMFLFKRFGYRQTTYMRDMLKREVIDRQNPMPLLRLLAGGVVGGEGVVFAKNKVKEWASGEPVYRKDEKDTLERYVNDVSAVGAYGVVSDMMDISSFKEGDFTGISKQAKFAAVPVLASDAIDVFEGLLEIGKEWHNYGEGYTALRREGPEVASKVMGSIPRWLSKRAKLPSQKTAIVKSKRRTELGNLRDLIVGKKPKEAKGLLKLWNKNNPSLPITNEDLWKKKPLQDRLIKKALDKKEAREH